MYHLLRKMISQEAPFSVFDIQNKVQLYQESFDATQYIDPNQGVFVGLNSTNQPVYWPINLLRKNHVVFMGESGSGKTAGITNIIAQCATHFEECVVIFDPKKDHYMFDVVRTYHPHPDNIHVIDLSPEAPAQINPFAGAHASDIEMMLIAALQLFNSGDAGPDFYRGEDRDAARLAAEIIAQKNLCFPEFLSLANKIPAIYKKTAFWRDCQQLGFLKPLQAHEGIDLKKCLQKGHVLFVLGSTAQHRTQGALRLLMQRVIQLLETRNQKECAHVSLFVDEIRYLLSEVLLTSLSTIRDKNVHLMLAFQDAGNLQEATAVNPRAVESIIMTNAPLKVVYRISHAPTLSTLEKLSGQRYWRGRFYPHIPAGLISHLPKPSESTHASVGVVFGHGPGYILRSRPMIIKNKEQVEQPHTYVIKVKPYSEGITSPHDLI